MVPNIIHDTETIPSTKKLTCPLTLLENKVFYPVVCTEQSLTLELSEELLLPSNNYIHKY